MNEKGFLPVEPIRAVLPRRIVATFVLAMLVFVGFDLAVVSVLSTRPELGNRTFLSFELQWKRLLSQDQSPSTLVLGDSSGYHGIDPDHLDAVLGSRGLNVCTMGDAAVLNSLWQLEAHLERHEAPDRVILVQVHDVWRREFRSPLLASVPLPWGFWRDSAVPVEYPPEVRRDAFLIRYVPVYALNETVGAWFERPWELEGRRLQLRDNGWAPVSSGDPAHVREDAANHLRYTVPGGWAISEESRRALEAMIVLAEAHDFDLYLVDAPLVDELIADAGFSAYLDAQHVELGRIVSTSERAHLVFDEPFAYPAEVMQNADHILRSEVEHFTRAIATRITEIEDRTVE